MIQPQYIPHLNTILIKSCVPEFFKGTKESMDMHVIITMIQWQGRVFVEYEIYKLVYFYFPSNYPNSGRKIFKEIEQNCLSLSFSFFP